MKKSRLGVHGRGRAFRDGNDLCDEFAGYRLFFVPANTAPLFYKAIQCRCFHEIYFLGVLNRWTKCQFIKQTSGAVQAIVVT